MNFDQGSRGQVPRLFLCVLPKGIEQVAGQELGAAGELSGDRRILGLSFIGLAQEGADAIGGIGLVLGQGASGELAESLASELGALLIGAAQLGLLLRSENLAEGGSRRSRLCGCGSLRWFGFRLGRMHNLGGRRGRCCFLRRFWFRRGRRHNGSGRGRLGHGRCGCRYG